MALVTFGGTNLNQNPLEFDIMRADKVTVFKPISGTDIHQYGSDTHAVLGDKNALRTMVFAGLLNADYVIIKALERTTSSFDDQGNFGGFFEGGVNIFIVSVEATKIYAMHSTDNTLHRFETKITFKLS